MDIYIAVIIGIIILNILIMGLIICWYCNNDVTSR